MSNDNATIENEVRTAIDAWAVCLDETGDYNIDPEDAPFIAAIHGAYVFDRNRATHCCELTPSYDLIYLYTTLLFTDAAHAASDERREELEELEEKYCYGNDSEDLYVHCHSIERMIDRNQRAEVSHYGDCAEHDREEDGTPEENYAKEMDSIRDDLCGNCPF